MSSVNNFVIRFANVNGTGSASANAMFAKTIFRMGVPVTPKNIFPSNIQGLPTWYEVRISEKGYLGRREGIDMMVCVNPQSMKKDIANVKSGGYFLYDSTKTLHEEYWREDIQFIGVPLMDLCNKHFTDARQKQLFKNMVYVGALAVLLALDFDEIEKLIAEQFQGKEKLIQPNLKALYLGADYVKQHFSFPLDIRVERKNLLGDKILVDGNSACGLGALYAGATVVPWYPITPSTSLVDAFAEYANDYRKDPITGKNNYAVIQAEDELSAIGMVIGAAWNGARAFTATSGPGVSLMNEFLGLAYFAEIPVVLVDVQRAGPSTGMPTRTQQADILMAAYASHGDTKNILLLPANPSECFTMMNTAFDLAEHFQTPVLVMTDLDLGMNEHISNPFEFDENISYNRGKILTADQLDNISQWGRYLDTDGDGVPYRTLPGTHATKGAYFTRGTSHDEYSNYTEDAATYVRVMERLEKKFKTATEVVPSPVYYKDYGDADYAMIFFGTSTYAAEEAMDILVEKGIKVNAMRLKSFPFCAEVSEFIENHKKVFVIEQNRDAQMRNLLINELDLNPKHLLKILNFDGTPITADFIVNQILQQLHAYNLQTTTTL